MVGKGNSLQKDTLANPATAHQATPLNTTENFIKQLGQRVINYTHFLTKNKMNLENEFIRQIFCLDVLKN